jgi:uncharacterized protein YjbI with pentapeptide repeats
MADPILQGTACILAKTGDFQNRKSNYLVDLKTVFTLCRADDLSGSVFNDTNLSGSQFNQINFSGVKFNDSNMAGWMIHDVNMSGSKIENTNLSGVEIANCRLSGLTIDGVPYDDLLEAYKQSQAN